MITAPKDKTMRAAFIVSQVYGDLHDSAEALQLNKKLSEVLLDSLDYLEYFMELEVKLPEAKFTDNEVANMKDITVGDFIDRVAAKMAD